MLMKKIVSASTAFVLAVAGIMFTSSAFADDTVVVDATETVVTEPAAEPVAEPVTADEASESVAPAPVVEAPAPAPVVEAPAPAPAVEAAPAPAAKVEAPAPAAAEARQGNVDTAKAQPEFICDETGTGWLAKVDWDGVGNPTVEAPDGYLIDGYCVKAGTTEHIIWLDEPADEVVIDHPLKDSVSHYQIHVVPIPDEPEIVAVQFDVTPTAPTCEAAGELDTSVFPIVRTGYTLTVDRPYDGPGDYTITATAHEGFVFSGEGNATVRSITVTVDGALGYQNDDPYEDCYVQQPPPKYDTSRECTAPGVRTITTSKAEYVWDAEAGEYVLGDWVVTFQKDVDDPYCLVTIPAPSAVVSEQTCDNLAADVTLTFEHATATYSLNGGPATAVTAGYYANPAPGTYVITLMADAGYEFEEGEDTLTVVVPEPLEECVTPVAVVFDVEPTAPTCDAAGDLDTDVFPIVREGYTLTVDRDYDGPGEYVITATANEGFTFEGEGDPFVRTVTITVDAAIGYQNTDPYAPCYMPPPPECVEGGDTTYQRYSWIGGPWESDEAPEFGDGSNWQANVQGDPHNVGQAGAYFRSHGNSGNGDWFYLEEIEIPPCDIEVTPTATWTPPTCDEDGELVLGPEEGVMWSAVDGEEPGSLVLTASPAEGYVFPDDAQTQWYVPNLDQLTGYECAELTASASWTTTPPTCDDLDGAGFLAYENATLVSATLNGEDYPSLGDFPEGNHPNPAPSGGEWTLTFEANEDAVFENGETTLVVEFTVPEYLTEEDCAEVMPTGIPFSAPVPAPTCTAGASFDAAALGGVFDAESGRWDFPNVSVEVVTSVPGEVTLNVFANEGYVIDADLVSDEWFVEAGGARASRTIELAPAIGFQTTNPQAACYQTTTVTTPPPSSTPSTTPTTTVVLATNTPAASPTSATLAVTGSNGAGLIGLAAVLAGLAGTGLVLARRRLRA
ncbi:hypothetical protein [Cellulomonas sp. Leaf395]|uniref:hypothetical protein n=1 Tax=Cellulomonas sp. Leaf395 TaxID=1736362 RepID=UPI0006FE7E09|nr:hypothetical protein [Cellulomonas sp. Leaf395]KQS97316.1 hypothetical protein ASG23_17360 [Cellulomonas sp. Leaf395]